MLENILKVPVVDGTGLADNFHIDLTWDQQPSVEALNQVLLDDLGLELAPAKQTIDILLVQQ